MDGVLTDGVLVAAKAVLERSLKSSGGDKGVRRQPPSDPSSARSYAPPRTPFSPCAASTRSENDQRRLLTPRIRERRVQVGGGGDGPPGADAHRRGRGGGQVAPRRRAPLPRHLRGRRPRAGGRAHARGVRRRRRARAGGAGGVHRGSRLLLQAAGRAGRRAAERRGRREQGGALARAVGGARGAARTPVATRGRGRTAER